jgi:hypothetical protein
VGRKRQTLGALLSTFLRNSKKKDASTNKARTKERRDKENMLSRDKCLFVDQTSMEEEAECNLFPNNTNALNLQKVYTHHIEHMSLTWDVQLQLREGS